MQAINQLGPKKQRLKILHVTESYGGGVATAIQQYIESTPELEHSLLRTVRTEHHDGADPEGFNAVHALPKNPVLAALKIRKISFDFDLLHVHSSVAGAITRLIPMLGRPIVYTPHCFAFERTDYHRSARWLVFKIEKFLAPRTDVFAACSIREATIASSFSSSTRAIYVPNVAPTTLRPKRITENTTDSPSIIGVGRISPQKDPAYFLECAKRILQEWPEATVRWYGGGDDTFKSAFEAAGIEVTGWLPQKRVLESIDPDSNIYLHTAAWEGFPMSILEINALGLPMIVRSIKPFENLDLGIKISSPSSVVTAVQAILGHREEIVSKTRTVLSKNTSDNQGRKLRSAYELAFERSNRKFG